MPKHEKMRLLLLGGTGEAAILATAIARLYPDIDLIVSLTEPPDDTVVLPGRVRIGRFGGVQGLFSFLQAEKIDAVIDATHPFAATISRYAHEACAMADIPRLMLVRPEWVPQPSDQWIDAADTAAAAAVLPALGHRVFLTVRYLDLPAFSSLDHVHFVVRLQEKGDEALPLHDYTLETKRPPFTVEEERALLRRHQIDLVVSRASGGKNGAPKLIAARMLGIPVLMIRRPRMETGAQTWTILGAAKWLKRRMDALN